jgi:hypothetical protein
MLVDNLCPSAPDKLHCETVERFDLAQKSDSARQKYSYVNSVIAKVLQEDVLKA